ncbi:MAG: hypothetical protein WCB01_08230, partial [Candidatus Cybelea sp.]
TRTVERYARAFPGSVVFVLPGSAPAVAESLADEINDERILGAIGRSRRRKLVKFLSFYFGLAERPLQTEAGKEILGTLNALAIANNLMVAAGINEAFADGKVTDPVPSGLVLMNAELRRQEVLAEPPRKKASPSKRNVTLLRNTKALF